MEKKTTVKCFLKLEEVVNIVKFSRQSIHRWRRMGIFPQPVDLAAKPLLWRRSEVERWAAKQK